MYIPIFLHQVLIIIKSQNPQTNKTTKKPTKKRKKKPNKKTHTSQKYTWTPQSKNLTDTINKLSRNPNKTLKKELSKNYFYTIH